MISKSEETAYRLVSHDFAGLTVEEAAGKMKISKRQVQRLLHSLRKKSPQLFPILTPNQNLIRNLIIDNGLSYKEIGRVLNRSEKTIKNIVQRLQKKKISFPKPPQVQQYQPYLDGEIVRKF